MRIIWNSSDWMRNVSVNASDPAFQIFRIDGMTLHVADTVIELCQLLFPDKHLDVIRTDEAALSLYLVDDSFFFQLLISFPYSIGIYGKF